MRESFSAPGHLQPSNVKVRCTCGAEKSDVHRSFDNASVDQHDSLGVVEKDTCTDNQPIKSVEKLTKHSVDVKQKVAQDRNLAKSKTKPETKAVPSKSEMADWKINRDQKLVDDKSVQVSGPSSPYCDIIHGRDSIFQVIHEKNDVTRYAKDIPACVKILYSSIPPKSSKSKGSKKGQYHKHTPFHETNEIPEERKYCSGTMQFDREKENYFGNYNNNYNLSDAGLSKEMPVNSSGEKNQLKNTSSEMKRSDQQHRQAGNQADQSAERGENGKRGGRREVKGIPQGEYHDVETLRERLREFQRSLGQNEKVNNEA